MAQYPKFDASKNNIGYDAYVEQKTQALKSVLHKWGLVLRNALKQQSGSTGALARSIQFRVEVRSRKDISTRVNLIVGVLDPDSPVLKYLKFILYGTRPHFVPLVYKGRSTGIFQWAKKHGLIQVGKDNQWRWAKGKLKGKRFRGIPNIGNTPNDFFTRVYQQYDDQIRRDIQRILEE